VMFWGRAENGFADPVLKSAFKLGFLNFCFQGLVQ